VTEFVSKEQSAKWAEDTIVQIKEEKGWKPKPNQFFCSVLCAVRKKCTHRG
jgi:hypothetical protein